MKRFENFLYALSDTENVYEEVAEEDREVV